MIDCILTRQVIRNKSLRKVLVDVGGKKYTMKISKVLEWSKDDFILKLKTGKDYPMGHKFIYRSIEECYALHN